MSDRWDPAPRGGRPWLRVAALAGLVSALAIGYASAHRADGGRRSVRAGAVQAQPVGGDGASRAARRPPPAKPRITLHPEALTTSPTAVFRFTDRAHGLRFRCRLDERSWRHCRSPVSYRDLAVGVHRFQVKATRRRSRPSAPARFRWRLFEAKEFSIEARGPVGPLLPGAEPAAVPVLLSNPNPVAILVTGVAVSVAREPAGCDSASNLLLIPSNASPAHPLPIPARASVELPGPGFSAPAIQLRDLPTNQDACQGAQFALSFSGSAGG